MIRQTDCKAKAFQYSPHVDLLALPVGAIADELRRGGLDPVEGGRASPEHRGEIVLGAVVVGDTADP